jgi:hypothetical protein
MGVENVEKVGEIAGGSVKRVKGRKTRNAEGLVALFTGQEDVELKDGDIGDEQEVEIKVEAETGDADKSNSGPEIDLKVDTDAVEILEQQTAEPSLSQSELNSAPAERQDELESGSTSIVHPGPLQSLDVNMLPPILDATSSSSSHLPIDTTILSLESKLSGPDHLPSQLPVYEDIPASAPALAAPFFFPGPSSSPPESLPAQSLSELAALTASTAELQTALITVQKRLEIVENRLDELETRDMEREAKLELLQKAEKEQKVRAERGHTRKDRHDHVLDSGSVNSLRNYATPDPSLGSLPGYVLVASLGIAVVVIDSLIECGKRGRR